MENQRSCKKNINNLLSIRLPNRYIICIKPTSSIGISNLATFLSIRIVRRSCVILVLWDLWRNHLSSNWLLWLITLRLGGTGHQNCFWGRRIIIRRLICGLWGVLLERCSMERPCFLGHRLSIRFRRLLHGLGSLRVRMSNILTKIYQLMCLNFWKQGRRSTKISFSQQKWVRDVWTWFQNYCSSTLLKGWQ